MSNYIHEVMEDIKEPTLKFELTPANIKTPSLNSYIGGRPYLKDGEHVPNCPHCKREMDFSFQIYMPKDKDYYLYVFYFCNDCDPFDVDNGYEMKIYKNPSIEDMNHKTKANPNMICLDFNFQPSWSLPDWETLKKLRPQLAAKLTEKYNKDAWILYENERDAFEGLIFTEPFSFFGGYPQFFSEPTYPVCDCCKETMNLWLQIDTSEDFGINWGDSSGCLFIFQCKKNPEKFKAIVQ